MRKITVVDRLLLLVTGFLAAYQVVVMEGLPALPTAAYTLAFGVLLVAGLLLIILGFEILDTPSVVIVATLVPVSLSVGLVSEYIPEMRLPYLLLSSAGLAAVILTRLLAPGTVATFTLIAVHGISGLIIFGLPLLLSFSGQVPAGFALVGVGGALIGVGGILLSLLKTGRPLLSRQAILSVLPGLLLLTTAAFVGGFWLA